MLTDFLLASRKTKVGAGSRGWGASALRVPPACATTGCEACTPAADTILHLPPDLDSEVSSVGLGTILRPNKPKSHSYFQSVSVTKVTLPDGVSVPAGAERRDLETLSLWLGSLSGLHTLHRQ